MSNTANRRSKFERREEARERARQMRLEQERRARRKRWMWQGVIVVAVAAIIALVVVIVNVVNRPAGPGPRNMASDGALIVATGDNKSLKTVTSAARPANADPVIPTKDSSGKTVSIVIYLDYLCPWCKLFESIHADAIKALVVSGAATFELHPIAWMAPDANDYSKRSANAAACVADLAPNALWDVNSALYKDQPDEKGSGLTNEQIANIVAGAKPPGMDEIRQCIAEQRFAGWITAATRRVAAGPLPNSTVKLTGTPVVLVNGERFEFLQSDTTPDHFKKFVQDTASKAYAANATTPAPSAS